MAYCADATALQIALCPRSQRFFCFPTIGERGGSVASPSFHSTLRGFQIDLVMTGLNWEIAVLEDIGLKPPRPDFDAVKPFWMWSMEQANLGTKL